MRITENRKYAILKLSGTILESNIKDLNTKFERIMLCPKKYVLVDLTEVNHICSMALGILVAYKKKFNENGRDIKVVVTEEDLLELFEITMLNKIFEIFPDIKLAEESLIL